MSTVPRPLTLRRNVAWTLLGNVGHAACQVGLLMVLAKLGTPEMVGQFVLGLAVAAPVFMFTNLGLRSVQATDSRREFRLGEYVRVRLWGSVIGLAAVAVIAAAAGYGAETGAVVLIIGVAKVVESFSDLLYGQFQQAERMDWIAQSKFLQGVFSLAGLTLGVAVTGSVVAGAVGYLTSWLLVLAAYDLRRAQRGLGWGGCWAAIQRRCTRAGLPPSVPTVRWWSLVCIGLPIGGTALLSSLNKHIPRYFIAHELGVYELGIFGALATLMMAGTTVSRALNQASCPRLAKLYAAGDVRGFRRLFGKLLAFYIAAAVGGVAVILVAGRPLVALLLSSEYAVHVELLVYVMAAAGVTYVAALLDTAMIAVRCLRPLLPLMCSTIVFAAAGCYWLIPRYGLTGAGMALGFSKVPMVFAGLWLLHRFLQREPPAGIVIEPPAALKQAA